MVTVGLYIYINDVARRIELFDDEKISINSSVQNASDISKVYTDFSQSFTVPANDHNNAIFSHWYENSIDGGYDARKRKKAYIELDTIPFRKGNIQLEKATIKNGVPEDYTITFFGSLVSLKDTFAGKKMFDLDYSDYVFSYSDTNVINRVKGEVSTDIKFPLISSSRLWSYSGADDITDSTKSMVINELFPALRLSKVFEAIETNYNISLQGTTEEPSTFLTDPRFTNSFLWLKNSDLFVNKGEEILLDFVSLSETPTALINSMFEFNFTNDSFKYNGIGVYGAYDVTSMTTYLNLHTSSLGIQCYVSVYKDDIYQYNIPFVTDSSGVGFELFKDITSSRLALGNYSFKISSNSPITFTAEVEIGIFWVPTGPGDFGFDAININCSNSQTTTSNINISSIMPDIKVEDFFSGILKMFNLTCLSYEDNVYTIEQLEDWYDSGSIIDISQYILSDDLSINKLETFKKINFNYIKSQSFMNVAYLGNNGTEYGDLKADLDAEGSEYSVEFPFENLLFNKFTGQDLQVGYSLKTDYKPYIPKPVILYDYGTLQTCDFYLKGNASSAVNITNYNCFGQDTLIDGVNYSLNSGIEISSLLLTPINNTLYSNYYQTYLQNIYNVKSRRYNVKSVLPISLLTSIKLNNRLIIRDRRYIINNMKIDLTTGEVDFELINDFRTL